MRDCVDYLNSAEALRSLEKDPYWPKWSSPWWRMTLLWELGQAEKIPSRAVEAMIQSMESRWVKEFPCPPGVDPKTGAPCHCALGTMYQVLHACGADVDGRMPWMREWFLKHQLADGGLNCDEASRVGSIVSTVPCLEAVLHCTKRPYTPRELDFLERGAFYLIERKLFRSKRTGKIIDGNWLWLCFPRFYQYDVLRGLTFLANWADKFKRNLPPDALADALKVLEAKGELVNERYSYRDGKGNFFDGGTADFQELREVSELGVTSPALNRVWGSVRPHVKA